MIIFLDAQGNIVVPSSPEAIGRNSNDAGIIYIVAPFSESTQIYLTFVLPNGKSLFGNLAEPTHDTDRDDTRKAATCLFKVPESVFSVWRYKIPASVTQYTGTVQYTIVAVTESMRATSSGSFSVSRGNKLVFPEPPPEDVWDKLITLWKEQGADIENLVAKLWGTDLAADAPGDNSVAQRVVEAEEDIDNLEKEIYGDEVAVGSSGSLRARMAAAESDIEKARNELEEFGDRLGAAEVADIAARANLVNQFTLQLKDGNGALVGEGVTLKLDLVCDNEYKLKVVLKDRDGNTLAESTVIDLPIETMISEARVSEDGETLTLVLKNGQSVSFSASKMLAGLATKADLDKINETLSTKETKLGPGTGTRVRIYYGTGAEGTYTFDNVNRSGKIPVYTSNAVYGDNNTGNGYLMTAVPVGLYHCANKKYVDDSLVVLEKTINDEISALREGMSSMVTGQPIAVASAEEMDAVLANADESAVGTVYEYTGETTENYENGALYLLDSTFIEFTVNDTPYRAVSGMTWAEWVASEYNPGNFFLQDGDDHVWYNLGSAFIYINDVRETETILENHSYSLNHSGSN